MPASQPRAARRNNPASSRGGRPRSVSTAQIVAAALELGLDTASFREIAARLGVATATIYRRVHSRDELLRLAAFELTLQRRLPQSGREHWSQLAMRYAESLFQAFVAEPQLIMELLKGGLGPHAEVDLLEQFLDTIAEHGFDSREGTALFHSIGMLVLGAASATIGLQASQDALLDWPQRMQAVLAEREPEELPRVREVFQGESPRSLQSDWRGALHALLSGIAQARGEALEPYVAGIQNQNRSGK